MSFLIRQTIVYAIPLIIVALAGVFAERSGIINLALEGIMIFGAFAGILFLRMMQGRIDFAAYVKAGQWQVFQGYLLITIVVVAAAGALFSLLLAFAAINLKANQTISGTALNMLSPALVLFLIRIIAKQNILHLLTGGSATYFMIKKANLGITDSNFFIDTFVDKVYITNYINIILFVVLSVILYKTKFGLRLRSCGENPQASASLGINVQAYRYIGTAISGALAGIGGFTFALTSANSTASGDVAGLGFLALALMIFGNWKPLNIAVGSVLFGLFKCIAASYAVLDLNGDGVYALAELGLNANFYRLIPYVVTLIVLMITSKNSRAPKAEGIPYDPGKR